MKKVLLIAFSYPPLAGMGMLRSLKFAKYLPAFGWNPVVLTIEPPEGSNSGPSYWFCDAAEGNLPETEIIRTKFFSPKLFFQSLTNPSSSQPSYGIRGNGVKASSGSRPEASAVLDSAKTRLRKFWNEWVEYPDSAIGWYPYAVKSATNYLRRNPVDAIFSTALPMTSHLVANTLSKRTGIPWVADFRDPWSRAHYRNVGRLRKRADQCLETRVVKGAGALITVSEPLVQDLLVIHETFKDKSHVIHNGFDAEDYPPAQRSPGRPLTITFTGRMYDIDFSQKGRTPEILFRSIAELRHAKALPPEGIQCLLYGEYPDMLLDMITVYGLERVVKCMGPVPLREALKAQAEADILLLLSWNDADREGILTGKIFEYLGAKRPILSIPFPNRGVEDILESTGAGQVITDLDTCKKQLCAWYEEFSSRGSVLYRGNAENIEQYSRKQGAKKLACVLDQVITDRRI